MTKISHDKEGHLSPSQFLEYLSCPQQYKYKRIDRLPSEDDEDALALPYGTAIHTIMDKINRLNIQGRTVAKEIAAEAFKKVFTKELLLAQKNVTNNKKEIETLQRKGIVNICRYLDRYNPRFKILHAEEELSFELPNAPVFDEEGNLLPQTFQKVIGRVDYVRKADDAFDDNYVTIGDFKTSKRVYKKDEVITNLQLLCYAYMIRKKYPEYIIYSVEYFVLVKNGHLQKIEVPLEKGWEDRFLREVTNIKKAIDNEIFYRNPVPKAYKCEYCPFFQVCWKTDKSFTSVKEEVAKE